MLKNKKASEIGLVEIFSWFLIVFVTLLFFILMNLPSCSGPASQKITSKNLADLKVGTDLSAYLRTPVDYQGTKMTVADLIVLSMENESLKTALVFGGLPLDIFDMTAAGLDSSFRQYIVQSKNSELTRATAELMKTYSIYIPAAAKKGLFCSFNVEASRKSDIITLFDSRYNWYKQSSCGFEYVVATAQIPDIKGEPITVALKATVDTAKVNAVIGVALINPAAGMLLADYLGII